MSTHCQIAKKLADGRITSIYVHFDGYPAYMEPLLEQHRDNIDAILAGGDASSIRPNLAESVYYKDRGEEAPATTVMDETEFRQMCKRSGAAYAYIQERDFTFRVIHVGSWKEEFTF